MRKEFRRFELLLPMRFNDGEPIPDEDIGGRLRRNCESDSVPFLWKPRRSVANGNMAAKSIATISCCVFVDIPDTPESREFSSCRSRIA